MQLGVPTLSGVGVEDVWNDLHEFSADGFSALDDVLPDVSAPHAVLQTSGKCTSAFYTQPKLPWCVDDVLVAFRALAAEADDHGLFPLMTDPFRYCLHSSCSLRAHE
jgi:hypothetical protein